MKHWSKYNTLFRSQRFGYFLYNALSNTLLKLDEPHYRFVEGLQSNVGLPDPGSGDEFLRLLREKRILVEEGQERELLSARQCRRDALRFDGTHLRLIICPTLGCNFRCPYCYQRTQHNLTVMDSKTVAQLIRFIKGFVEAKDLSIVWYGGEPTLAFGVVLDLTARIKELDVAFRGATLITNGYLLNSDIIKQLNNLRINAIQITLDGPKEVHDVRRVLADGQPTFQQIMDNIESLMNSSYEGQCRVRINVDKNNLEHFIDLRTSLLERFRGNRLSVHSAHVITALDHTYDRKCKLCAKEWSDFNIVMYRNNGIPPKGGLFPDNSEFDVCFSNSCNAYFIGPEGELYKCSEDLGIEEMVIGNIFNDEPVSKPELMSLYITGTDPHLDAECLECKALPICGGGCANRRLRTKFFNEKGLEFCSRYKDDLVTYLEEYYHEFLIMEICHDVCSPGVKFKEEKGYRIVQGKRREWGSAEFAGESDVPSR